MPHARFRPPDPSKGDPSTIGGYAAVHDRPAAFDGSDGFSYSVELVAEPIADDGANDAPRWGAFLLFIRWARVGAQSPEGHLETDYLLITDTETDALAALGETPLTEVKLLLDRLIAARSAESGGSRRWWDAMHDDGATA